MGGTQGSIAFDDIAVSRTNGSCAPERECTFQGSLCGLRPQPSAHFGWKRITGTSQPLNSSGPTVDHTLGTEQGLQLLESLTWLIALTKINQKMYFIYLLFAFSVFTFINISILCNNSSKVCLKTESNFQEGACCLWLPDMFLTYFSTNTNNHVHNSTLHAGYYLSAQLWSHPVGSRGAMVTATMEPTPPDGECLMFWYYMEGSGVGDLSVHLQSPDGHRKSQKLWDRSGDQGKHWRHGRVTLFSPDTRYQVGSHPPDE